jgi:hypothetical protein
MGILNSNNVILDAQLTTKGREYMLNDNKRFNITKWALADPEINYNELKDSLSGDGIINTPISFEPSVVGEKDMQYKIIRSVDNYQQYLSEIVSPTITPDDEYVIRFTKNGNELFSLSDFTNESISYTFSVTLNKQLLLSNSFIVDMSSFWDNYDHFNFDVVGVSPVGFTTTTDSATSSYWYVADTKYTKDGNVKPVIIGLSNNYKTSDSVNLESFKNDLNSGSISFRLTVGREAAMTLYKYMSKNQIDSITDKIYIRNADTSLIPRTNYYGIGAKYSSISTPISITITI